MYYEKPPSPNRAALKSIKTRLFGHYDQLYHLNGKEEFQRDISVLSVQELEELKEDIIEGFETTLDTFPAESMINSLSPDNDYQEAELTPMLS